MSTHADRLNAAKKLIAEHVETNWEKFYQLKNGMAAVYAICKDLDILSDRILVDLAKDTYNEILHKKELEKAMAERKDARNIPNEEKDAVILELQRQLELLRSKGLQLIKETKLATDILGKENKRLKALLDAKIAQDKLEENPRPGFFSRLAYLFRGSIPNDDKTKK